jgi:hypothetical protein
MHAAESYPNRYIFVGQGEHGEPFRNPRPGLHGTSPFADNFNMTAAKVLLGIGKASGALRLLIRIAAPDS